MKTLFILRHAKSSWDNPNLNDFDRPLNERGRRSAPLMGRVMAENNFDSDLLVSSPAVRARETAVLVKDAAGLSAALMFDKRIYEASSQILVQIISEFDESADSALMVGHNPGLENLIKLLTCQSRPMPTAALAVVDLTVKRWKAVSANSGNLRKIFLPKEEMRARQTDLE